MFLSSLNYILTLFDFRWDLSLVDQMPGEMKICFMALYNMVNEIAEDGRKRHGCDVLRYIRNVVCIKFIIF